jgi:hypothetical protein
VLHVSTLLGHLQATHLLEGTSIALLRLLPMDYYQHVIIRSRVCGLSMLLWVSHSFYWVCLVLFCTYCNNCGEFTPSCLVLLKTFQLVRKEYCSCKISVLVPASATFVLNISYYVKYFSHLRTRYAQKDSCLSLHAKYAVILHDFNQNRNVSTDLSKLSPVLNFMKTCLAVVTCGQSGTTKLIEACLLLVPTNDP